MALVDDYLAALFVRPDRQGREGHALLQEAKSKGPGCMRGCSWKTIWRCASIVATVS